MIVAKPNGIRTACGLSLLAGILCFAFLALDLEGDEMLKTFVAYMMCAILFFALAGGCAGTKQWNSKTYSLMTYVALGATILGMITGYISVLCGGLLLGIGICVVILSILPSSKTWLDSTQ